MPKLIMTKGLPASGKTTWAKAEIRKAPTNSMKRVNKDDLRAMLDDSQWSKGNEKLVLAVRDNAIDLFLYEGKHVIVDDTNFEPKHEERLREIANKHNAQFVIQDFTDVSKEECIKRNKTRDNPVPEEVIVRMAGKYLKTYPTRVVRKHDPDKPTAIICDIDGTLAHNGGHRGWHEYSKVGGDEVHDHVKELLINLTDTYKIVLLSGREDSCLQETIEWLHTNFIPFDELYMRDTGDYRNDAVVKRELYDKYIAARFNVEFVLDDRNLVVDMWRKDLHLPCLQVNYGDF